jgi:hypothetical protein
MRVELESAPWYAAHCNQNARPRALRWFRPARRGAPTPVGFAIGPTGVGDIGLDHTLSAPVTGRTLGRERAPTVWCDLADRPPDDAWSTLNDLMKHLRPQGPDPDQS